MAFSQIKGGSKVVFIVDRNGKKLASSKNLEVLSRYARKHRVTKTITRKESSGRGYLCVYYANGARGDSMFASYNVLQNWIATKRSRSGWA